ncbi:MAG TPA: hypothetical protein VFL80_01545, partial [Thermoanaerobaculia bacterium]|nr:hypothetical protein [Thermoanaerobaculia bacterium]
MASDPRLVVLTMVVIFGPFVGLGIWAVRYWARRSKELAVVASRLGARFSAKTESLPSASEGFLTPHMGRGFATNVLDGSRHGVAYTTFDLTVVGSRNSRQLHTVACFGAASTSDSEHFVVFRGRGSYQPWPEPRDLAEAGAGANGIRLLSRKASSVVSGRAEAIAAYFERVPNASRSPSGAWFVEASSGRILL